jgi:hypothetical protein
MEFHQVLGSKVDPGNRRDIMSARKLTLAAILVLGLSIGRPAHAALIDYTFSGTFDGSLNGVGYSDQNFTITLVGDTSNVTFGGGEYSNTASAATFTVGGTQGTLTGTSNEIVSNPSFSSGTIIFGQAQPGPAFVAEGGTGFGTYDLTTAYLLTLASGVSQTMGSTYLTSLGNLVFNNITSVSFQASLIPTPLPSTLPLLAAVVAILGIAGWYKKQKIKLSR